MDIIISSQKVQSWEEGKIESNICRDACSYVACIHFAKAPKVALPLLITGKHISVYQTLHESYRVVHAWVTIDSILQLKCLASYIFFYHMQGCLLERVLFTS